MIGDEAEVYYAERKFFSALSEGLYEALDELLADDFLLIDVFSGAEFTKSALLAAVRSRELKFEEINRLDWWVRFYTGTTVATGSTQMLGRFGDDPFEVSSRYSTYLCEAGRSMATGFGTGNSNYKHFMSS